MRSSLWSLVAAAIVGLPSSAHAQQGNPAASKSESSYYSGNNNYWTGDTEDPATEAAKGNSFTSASGFCGDCCCDGIGTWRDNTLVWLGGEAYKSLGDIDPPPALSAGYMDSAGAVTGFNTGFGLGQSRIRGQIGASYGIYDWKGRDTVSTSSAEQQVFVTAGVYKRSDVCCGDRVSWGLVYDQFFAHQWGLFASELYVGQVRAIAGYALNEHHEIGVWGAFRATGDNSVDGISPPAVRAMNQYNAYWRYNWDFGGQTMLYFGSHDPADIGSWVLGVLGQAPLSDRTALYGNFTYALPGSATGIVGSNELEWNLGLGLVYSLGGKAVSPTVSGQPGLPLLPVANNGSFLITN